MGILLEPNPANHCFGCGAANQRGMRLMFERDDHARRIRGTFCIGPEYQGGPAFVHGGIVATLLDEVMSKVSLFDRDHSMTAELSIEYLKPVPIGSDVTVEGWELERKGRSRLRQGEVRDASGAVLARGKGRFVELRKASDQPA